MTDNQTQADQMREQAAGSALSEIKNNVVKGKEAEKKLIEQETKRSDYSVANQVLAKWGKPVAYYAGEFWSFSKNTGWSVCTDELSDLANEQRGRNTEKTVMPIIANKTAIPRGHAQESVYWEKVGRKWVPLKVKDTEIVLTDVILDVITDEAESLAGRTVFGPMISLPYGIDEEPETDDEFVNMVTERVKAEELGHFQEVMSTVLQPHVTLRGQIVLYGTAHAGKTTLATAIACCPNGRAGLSQMQEAGLVRDKFATNGLVNMFSNVSDDSPITKLWVGFLKQYTSGNVTVEPKYCKPQSLTPTAKLISTCNEIQSLVDASGAATDRLLLFRFDKSLPKCPGSSTEQKMTAVYWSEPKRRAGVLTWLLEGLKRLRTRGQFDPPKSWTVNLEAAKACADPTHELLRETFVYTGNDEDFVSSKQALEALEWKQDQYYTLKFYQYAKAVWPDAQKTNKKMDDGRRLKGLKGLKVIE